MMADEPASLDGLAEPGQLPAALLVSQRHTLELAGHQGSTELRRRVGADPAHLDICVKELGLILVENDRLVLETSIEDSRARASGRRRAYQ